MRFFKIIFVSSLLAFSMSMMASDKANLNSVYRLIKNKDYQSAVDKLEVLVKKYPDDADAWYEYSLALVKNGNTVEAIKASKKSATFAGYHKYAVFNLGIAYAMSGDQHRALKNITQSMHEGYLNFDRLKNEEALTGLRKAGHFNFAPEQEYQSFTAIKITVIIIPTTPFFTLTLSFSYLINTVDIHRRNTWQQYKLS